MLLVPPLLSCRCSALLIEGFYFRSSTYVVSIYNLQQYSIGCLNVTFTSFSLIALRVRPTMLSGAEDRMPHWLKFCASHFGATTRSAPKIFMLAYVDGTGMNNLRTKRRHLGVFQNNNTANAALHTTWFSTHTHSSLIIQQ